MRKIARQASQAAHFRVMGGCDLTRTAFPMILVEFYYMGVLGHEEFTQSE